MFLCNFNQIWRTGSLITLLDSYITQVSFQTALYCWVCQMLYKKPLSKLLTCILSAVKTGLQSYCDTNYSRGCVNQMWILKNSKDLLEYIQSRSLSSCNSIKTFDFSTLYTTIPHSKLKDKLRELVQLCFIKKNDQRRYKYLVLGRDRSYFVKKKPLWFYQKVLWNWYHQHARVFDWQQFAIFSGRVFQQTVGHTYEHKLIFSPTCSFIRMRETSYKGF